jgi:beta-galactosidase
MWRVPFEAGTLKAVSRKNGKVVLSKEIRTAGKPAKIELMPGVTQIKAGSEELIFIKVKITDAKGNLVPGADNLIEFSITGTGALAAADNGLQTSHESFQAMSHHAYNGLCLAIVKGTGKKGKIVVKANGKDLEGAVVTINVD